MNASNRFRGFMTLASALVLLHVSVALAGSWTCPYCGQTFQFPSNDSTHQNSWTAMHMQWCKSQHGGGSGRGSSPSTYGGASDPSTIMMGIIMNQATRQFQQMWNQPTGPSPQEIAAEQAHAAEAARAQQEQVRQARTRIANVFRQSLDSSEMDMKDSLAGVLDVATAKRSTAFFGIEGNPDTSGVSSAKDPSVYSDTSVVDLRDLGPGLEAQRDYGSGRFTFQAADPGPAGAVLMDAGAIVPTEGTPMMLRTDPSKEGGPISSPVVASAKPVSSSSPNESSWQKLKNGVYWGTGMGEESAQWYADHYAATGKWYYGAGGLAASLWTPDTYRDTINALSLVTSGLELGDAALTAQPKMTQLLVEDLKALSQNNPGIEIGIAGSFSETVWGNRLRELASEYPELEKMAGIPWWRGGKNILSEGKDVDIWFNAQQEISAADKEAIITRVKGYTNMSKHDLFYGEEYSADELYKAGVTVFKDGEMSYHHAPWQRLMSTPAWPPSSWFWFLTPRY
jgi:hypothetical protein